MHDIQFTVNGHPEHATVASTLTLLDLLRDRLALTGTKEGCGIGECGACTVLLDGNPIASCLMLAVEADGHAIETIEGESVGGELSVLQQAFIDEGATQCGFCTPGMIMSARGLLNRTPHPSREEIVEAIAGNLCRCTGYEAIVAAIQLAATRLSQDTDSGATKKGGKS
jgi:aerobic carbon-monoxide dehydrogenase small subunit